MSYQEKKKIVSIISTVLITGFYALYVYQKYQAGVLDTSNIFQFWSLRILILIPVSIVSKIIIHIVFSIIIKVAFNEDEPSFTDELDKLIELKSIRNSFYLFMGGFLLSIISQAIGMSPSWLFIILFISGMLSDIFGEISSLYFYSRGI